jgi:hypothetical protein
MRYRKSLQSSQYVYFSSFKVRVSLNRNQGQEAQYNAKVDAVKAEHDQLLQEAFSKAKVREDSLYEDRKVDSGIV